jgi:hypothetical protein
MEGRNLEVLSRHARLHEGAARLFRAMDDRDVRRTEREFQIFLEDLEEHLRVDLTIGYRLLLRHSSQSVRAIAERVINEQSQFPEQVEAMVVRWRPAGAQTMLSQAFRDELETLVSNLLKRIRLEQRLLSALSSVA